IRSLSPGPDFPQPATESAGDAKPPFDSRLPFHLCMLGLALLFVLASGIGMALTRTSLQGKQTLPLVGLWLCLLAGSSFYRWRHAALPRSGTTPWQASMPPWGWKFPR